MQFFQKENDALHAACVVEKALCTESLLELTARRMARQPARKRVEELSRHLAGELSVQIKSVADKRYSEDAMVVKEKLTKQVKKLSALVDELVREIEKQKEAVTDLNIKLEGARNGRMMSHVKRTVSKLACSSFNAKMTRRVKATLTCKMRSIASTLVGKKSRNVWNVMLTRMVVKC